MILCCGEALIDMIPEPTTSGRSGFVPHCGGAIFNTALALGRLGAPAGLLTGMSRDRFGEQLMSALADAGVDSRFAIRTDRPTTLAFVQVEDGQAQYTFVDENSAGRMLRLTDFPTLTADVSALYLGGISLACAPGAAAYAVFLAREHAGRAVMIDPNIRAGFITDETAYRTRLSELIRLADIVKVSDEDLNWLAEADRSGTVAARDLLHDGPSVVIVTEGASGARAYLKNGDEVFVPAVPAKVVDTVGAGDTFNAGVLFALLSAGLLSKAALRICTATQIEQALAFGARVASVTVSRAGANPPWLSEV